MAPTKFQIYVDQSIINPGAAAEAQEPETVADNVEPQPMDHQLEHCRKTESTNAPDQPARYKPESLPPNLRFYFDERKLYPVTGGEYSFEEINFFGWIRKQKQLADKIRMDELQRENLELREKIEELSYQLINAQRIIENQNMNHHQEQHQQASQQNRPQQLSPTNRLSIVPQSLQPTQGMDYADISSWGSVNDDPSVVRDLWKNTIARDKITMPIDNTFARDKITLPIDQSQFFKDNIEASTPISKTGNNQEKRSNFNGRRMSRPSMGGSPTLKLSPITETSRDCNSKSSSSSSAMSNTPCTTKRDQPVAIEPAIIEEPDRPLDPNDASTYRRLLKGLTEPLERRPGYFRLNRSVPRIRQGACFQAGADSYLVDKELSSESKMYTAQLLTDDSNDSSMDLPIKTICFRVDQPANDWLFYICNELHKRLVKQKTKPDIELSIMIANPAVMYNDGSILIDEYFRFVSLDHFFEACKEMNKPFPRSVAAYITMELIQLVRQMHSCDIIHMNINPRNVLITCCPTRDDIASVDERTSIVKLIGFDRAMDTRLLPAGFKFDTKLDDMITCEMMDSKPWSFEVDWFGALNCIYKMFFLEDMVVKRNEGRWTVDKQFKGFPTNIWSSLFDELLNISDLKAASMLINQGADELNTWIKANINFVLKEADYLDRVLEDFCRATNRSIRT